jgi:DNA-binding NarL/FixJ family response regulator
MDGSEENEPIRLVIADDDALARRVLRDALQEAGFVVIAEAADGREAVELASYYEPDVVVMDVVMPRMDGLEATRRLGEARPGVKVILLTSSDDDETGVTGLRAGAVGFLSKGMDLDALPRALESAYRGEAVVSRRLTMRLVETIRLLRPDGAGMRPVRSTLTSREWEVLDLMCEGRSTDGIADDLFLSPETVRSHVKGILRKLEVTSRTEAVAVARRLRLGDPSGTEARSGLSHDAS